MIRDNTGNARTMGLMATSAGVHMVVFAAMNLLPSVSEVQASLAENEVDFTVTEPEKLPEPPPPEPEPEPEPEPPKPQRIVRPVAPEPVPTEPEPPAPVEEAPVDFTGQTLTAEGPGPGWTSVVGNGQALTGPVGRIGTKPGPATPTTGRSDAPAPVAPAKSQARLPGAPTGLDRLLEENFPRRASQQGVHGVATVRVRVTPDGQVGSVRVLSETGDYGFGQACVKTVSGGRWRPALDAAGRPVPYDLSFTCRFEIRD